MYRTPLISNIFDDAHPGVDKDKMLNDTVVHEIGHQFGLEPSPGGHVDSNDPYPNHLGLDHDDCIMTYHTNNTDEESEFCTDCIDEVRDYEDPL